MSKKNFIGEKAKYLTPKPARNVDLQNANPQKLEGYINAPVDLKFLQSGIGGNPSIEPVPAYHKTPSDKVVCNERNAWIVLGTDRENTPLSGYGGKGHTQSAAIDIVVGRMGSYVRERDDNGNLIRANPDFKIDAARIYISQKSDIDEYFELPDGTVGNAIAASAIALKADEIRLVARGGIKLVTGLDFRNSRGERIIKTVGIDLIGGAWNQSSSDLQPLVKGDNLVDALSELSGQIDDLREIVYSFLKYQRSINMGLLQHQHNSNWPGGPNAPSTSLFQQCTRANVQLLSQTETSIVSHQANQKMWESNYLSEVFASSILSAHNTTT